MMVRVPEIQRPSRRNGKPSARLAMLWHRWQASPIDAEGLRRGSSSADIEEDRVIDVDMARGPRLQSAAVAEVDRRSGA
ncbi:hypothetical protein ACPA9J_04615 [Pseudomonas aeruginosa]